MEIVYPTRRFVRLLAPAIFIFLAALPVAAQVKSLSSGDVLKRYAKAAGGDKALRNIRDTTYRGTVAGPDDSKGTFQFEVQAPDRKRLDVSFEADNRLEIATPTSVWKRATRSGDVTLLDEQARAVRAETFLLADRKLDFKARSMGVRSLPPAKLNDTWCYVLEFTSRQRAQVKMYFDAATFLPSRIESGEGETLRRFDFFEYRKSDGVPEPSRIEFTEGGGAALVLAVEIVRHNQGLAADRFRLPNSDAAIDIAALFESVRVNQRNIDDLVKNYTYTATETVRKLNKEGQVEDTTVKVYEVYPLSGRENVRKLVSVNGKPLSAGDAERERKMVAKMIEEHEKRQKRNEEARVGAQEDDNGKRTIRLRNFLKACDFINPRRESLRGRSVVVCDFRPKANFKSSDFGEKVANMLSGTVWIDEQDRVVSRLEGLFDKDYKVGGGLIASLKKGAAFCIEQTRTDEGAWFPYREDFNAGLKIFLLAGLNLNAENRYSDYKRFTVTTNIDFDDKPNK